MTAKSEYFAKDEAVIKKKVRLHNQEVLPDTFERAEHFYPLCINASIHSAVACFLSMTPAQIAGRFAHLHRGVDAEAVLALLKYPPRLFRWAGSDLFSVITESGKRQMVVIEVNSSPSGQKSMPPLVDSDEYGGYMKLVSYTFAAMEKGSADDVPHGVLAVIYDKNFVEASGYAAAIAQHFSEPCYLVEYRTDPESPDSGNYRFDAGVLWLRVPQTPNNATNPLAQPATADDAGSPRCWLPVRACHRYVTQAPWKVVPIITRTRILNPIICCLAGGRNKLLAAKAYQYFNATLAGTGLAIAFPHTVRDVARADIPRHVAALGGRAVVKVPYSNAGQGVYTITSPAELAAFVGEADWPYDQYIVQQLIGNAEWSSTGCPSGRLYHSGTLPNKHGSIFATDLRFMVAAGADGFQPVGMYGRRARKPLARTLDESNSSDSWAMLGTNLSTSLTSTDTKRLILMDRQDFNKLGLAIDDLVEAYLQTVMSVIAIDMLALKLLGVQRPESLLHLKGLDEGLAVEETARAAEAAAIAAGAGGGSAAAAAAAAVAELQSSVQASRSAEAAAAAAMAVVSEDLSIMRFDIDFFLSLNLDLPLVRELCAGIGLDSPVMAEVVWRAAEAKAASDRETVQ